MTDKRQDRVKTALYELRTTILEGKSISFNQFCKKYKFSNHFSKALKELKIIEQIPSHDLNGMYKWIYKNDLKTDEVDNVLARKTIDKVREIEKMYAKITSEKKAANKPKITQAVAHKEEVTFTNLNHQLIFLKDQLEKEKLVKGYLRPNEVLFYKGIVKSLEDIQLIKELKVFSM
jgi:hypothetical protein